MESRPIAILGAGAWGLSTALHLVESGHTNITVFDRSASVPSPYSAANDLNKIIRPEYEDVFYTHLTLEAMEAWKSPLFGPHFHHTGYINCVSGQATEKSVTTVDRSLGSISRLPGFAGETHLLRRGDDFRNFAWQLTGRLAGFRGYFNRRAGYAHSSDALAGVYSHCASRGVRFLLGPETGKVEALTYEGHDDSVAAASGGDGRGQRCTGVRTADGRSHPADLVVCALGANAASLVPDVGSFAVARSWLVTHVQLTDEETRLLRGLPVVNVRDLGFFFEPDPVTRLFKLCPLGAGYTNRKQLAVRTTKHSNDNNNNNNNISLPPDDISHPGRQGSGIVPAQDERKLRTLLRETLPWLADRPFVDSKFCWFSDTADSEYCIDFVPGTSGSLVVLAGDSGHGFKMMPLVGKWVLELLGAGRQSRSRWQWKSSTGATQETSGSHDDHVASWRVGTSREVGDVIDEQTRFASRL